MRIRLRDHKMLWGRSGMRCAMCHEMLDEPDVPHGATVIGVEAHIVSEAEDGPRGKSPLNKSQRNSYPNLILLCPNDHARIDAIPAGPLEFTVERLLEIKRAHEKTVTASGDFDPSIQEMEEQWAELVDRLDERMGWSTWKEDLSGIFDPNVHGMDVDVERRLSETCEWIFRRVWPQGHPRLRLTIETMGQVVNDFVTTFSLHVEPRPSWEAPKSLHIERFYKIDEWDEPRYQRLSREHDEHVLLVQDLALEMTRYGNYVADVVREEIDRSYRFDEGLLVITCGPMAPDLGYYTYRPRFDADDFSEGEPYRGREQFRRDRVRRSMRGEVDDDE